MKDVAARCYVTHPWDNNLLANNCQILAPWLFRFVADIDTLSSLVQIDSSVFDSLLSFHANVTDIRPTLSFEMRNDAEEAKALSPLTPALIRCVRNVQIKAWSFCYMYQVISSIVMNGDRVLEIDVSECPEISSQLVISLLRCPSVRRVSLRGCKSIGGRQARAIVRAALFRDEQLFVDLTDTAAVTTDIHELPRLLSLANYAGVAIEIGQSAYN